APRRPPARALIRRASSRCRPVRRWLSLGCSSRVPSGSTSTTSWSRKPSGVSGSTTTARGRAETFRRIRRRAGPAARAGRAGLRTLTLAERRAWDHALSYYVTNVLTDRMEGADSVVARVNDRLAASPEESLEAPALDPALAAALTEVGPIYRAVWWPIHDAH